MITATAKKRRIFFILAILYIRPNNHAGPFIIFEPIICQREMKTIFISLISLYLCNINSTSPLQEQSYIPDPHYKTDSIDHFWSWFVKNQKRLRNFQSDPDKYLNELFIEIKKVKTGLAIEFEPPQNGIINMTVSANGNVELFQLVRDIVERAPAVKGWKFIAFRQRMPAIAVKEIKLKVGELVLEPAQMKFFPVIENQQLNIIIYAKGITEQNYNQVAYACFILLDNILGEYDCTVKVSSFDFHQMPDQIAELNDLKPFLELASYVDSFYKQRNN